MTSRASTSEVKEYSFKHSSRKLPLNDSMREALATLSQSVGVALRSLSEAAENGIASLIEGQREILAELRRLRP